MLPLKLGAWFASFPIITIGVHAVLLQVGNTPGIDTAIAAGVPGVLGFLVLGFINEWIVPGRTYRRVLTRSDRLEATLYKAAGATQALAQTLGDEGT